MSLVLMVFYVVFVVVVVVILVHSSLIFDLMAEEGYSSFPALDWILSVSNGWWHLFFFMGQRCVLILAQVLCCPVVDWLLESTMAIIHSFIWCTLLYDGGASFPFLWHTKECACAPTCLVLISTCRQNYSYTVFWTLSTVCISIKTCFAGSYENSCTNMKCRPSVMWFQLHLHHFLLQGVLVI